MALSESTTGASAGYVILVIFVVFVAVGAAVVGRKSWRAHQSKDNVQDVEIAPPTKKELHEVLAGHVITLRQTVDKPTVKRNQVRPEVTV